MTITREKRGRPIASAAPDKLLPTTRCADLGRNPALEVQGERRFSEDELKVLAPSLIAAELAFLLGKDAEWLNDYRLAARPGRFQLSDEQEDTLARIKREERNPSAREDLISAFRQRAREEHESRMRQCRANAKRWLRLVGHYERNREWLSQFPPNIRARLCRQMADGIARASANDVIPENREEDRRRKGLRREARTTAKRLHKNFGYRNFRRPIPVKPNGEIDFEGTARLDFGVQAATEGTGVSFVGDKYTATEDLRIAKRITDEMQSFWRRKKDRSI